MYEFKGFPATEEQIQIVEKAKTKQSFKVQALAGAAKTSTAILLSTYDPVPTLYACFNKKVADEAAGEFPSCVRAQTLNSIAYRHTISPFPSRRNRLKFNVYPRDLLDALGVNYHVANSVLGLVKNFCNSRDSEISEKHVGQELSFAIKANPDSPEAKALNNYVELARKYWSMLWEPGSPLDLAHDYYLKLFSLTPVDLGFERIIVDEAQDMNPASTVIIEAQTNSQIIWIGDENQQIYAWRGAINHLSSLELPELTLSNSFRFGPQVATPANLVLKALGVDQRVVGKGPASRLNPKGFKPKRFTMVGRTNAGLLDSAILALKKEGKSIHFPYAKEVKVAVESALQIKSGDTWKVRHPPFKGISSWEEFSLYAESEQEFKAIANLLEKYGKKVLQIIEDVEKASTKLECEADAVFMTTHKAKGAEWDNVILCSDFSSVAFKNEETGKILKEELNLVYVAMTRAMKNLMVSPEILDKLKSVI